MASSSHKGLWGYSSAGRASDLHSEGHRFDPVYLHQGLSLRRLKGKNFEVKEAVKRELKEIFFYEKKYGCYDIVNRKCNEYNYFAKVR